MDKVSKFYFTIFIIIFLCYQVGGVTNFLCLNETSQQLTKYLSELQYLNRKLFVVVSFAVTSNEQKPHNFVRKRIQNVDNFDKVLSLVIQERYEIDFNFTEHYEFVRTTLHLHRATSSFHDDNQTCSDDVKSVYTTGNITLKSPVLLSPTLLYGCIVWTKHDILQVKKSVILIANHADGSRFKDAEPSEILRKRPLMTDLNYDMFLSRGFCICDDIIEYLECGKPLVTMLFTVPLLIFTFVLTFISIKLLSKIFTSCKKVNAVHPAETLPPQSVEVVNLGNENEGLESFSSSTEFSFSSSSTVRA